MYSSYVYDNVNGSATSVGDIRMVSEIYVNISKYEIEWCVDIFYMNKDLPLKFVLLKQKLGLYFSSTDEVYQDAESQARAARDALLSRWSSYLECHTDK